MYLLKDPQFFNHSFSEEEGWAAFVFQKPCQCWQLLLHLLAYSIRGHLCQVAVNGRELHRAQGCQLFLFQTGPFVRGLCICCLCMCWSGRRASISWSRPSVWPLLWGLDDDDVHMWVTQCCFCLCAAKSCFVPECSTCTGPFVILWNKQLACVCTAVCWWSENKQCYSFRQHPAQTRPQWRLHILEGSGKDPY